MKKLEQKLQTAVSKYIKLKYPNVIFTSESSGIKVSMGIAVQMKRQRSNHKLPDMIILEPRGSFCGLMLELKKDRNTIYSKRTGELLNNAHVQEQAHTLNLLQDKGYEAVFACGLDEAIEVINKYMLISI